jgi:hypothetical protein
MKRKSRKIKFSHIFNYLVASGNVVQVEVLLQFFITSITY